MGEHTHAFALMEGMGRILPAVGEIARDREVLGAQYCATGAILLRLGYDPSHGMRVRLTDGTHLYGRATLRDLPTDADALHATLFGTADGLQQGLFDPAELHMNPQRIFAADPQAIADTLLAFGREQREAGIISAYGLVPAKDLVNAPRDPMRSRIAEDRVSGSYIRKKNGAESTAMEVGMYPQFDVEEGGVQASVVCYRTEDLRKKYSEHRKAIRTPISNMVFKMPLTTDALALVARGCFDPAAAGELERNLRDWAQRF